MHVKLLSGDIIKAKYIVGADGVHSKVREAIGAKLIGNEGKFCICG